MLTVPPHSIEQLRRGAEAVPELPEHWRFEGVEITARVETLGVRLPVGGVFWTVEVTYRNKRPRGRSGRRRLGIRYAGNDPAEAVKEAIVELLHPWTGWTNANDFPWRGPGHRRGRTK